MPQQSWLRPHIPARDARVVLVLATCAALFALASCGVSATASTASGHPATPTATVDYCSPAANPGKATQYQGCSGTPITGRKGLPDCGGAGQPACPPPPPVPNMWTHVASAAPADVLDALQRRPDFMTPVQAFPAPSGSTYSFDTPVLVLPATTGPGANTNGVDLPYFVIRAFVNGVRTVTYSVHYDPDRQQLEMGSVGVQSTNDPHYGKPFPWEGVSADAAVQAVQAQRGLGIRPGSSPQLVDFALDPRAWPPAPSIQWSGGGYNEAVPIWRLIGADGRLYFVGINAHVYDASQLPIAPDATLIQP